MKTLCKQAALVFVQAVTVSFGLMGLLTVTGPTA